MTKVAFIQNLAIEYIGTMYLSAALKAHNHQTEVFIGSDDKRLIPEILHYRPDLLAFSCTTGTEPWCLQIASRVKEQISVKILFGGPHPTFFPDVIREEPVDIICRGEGDQAIVEIADMLDKVEYSTDIANCWFRVNSEVIKNPPRMLIKNLDSLPFPDRNLYRRKYPSLRSSTLSVFTGRGCPYDCSYCYNKTLKDLYKDKGVYVRKRSVDNVIDEIKRFQLKNKIKTVYFCDDTFFVNRNWLVEFAAKYKQQINIPYICLLRVEQIDEFCVALLKDSNCQRVFFGIESGSEDLRLKILNRQITDRQIIDAARLFKQYAIPFRTYNMIGLPGETLDDAFKTVKLNIDIGTDYPWCSLFYPYPGTELNSYADRNNLLMKEDLLRGHVTFFKKSIVKSEFNNALSNLQKFFLYAVKFPILLPFIKKMIQIKANIFFDLLFLAGYGWGYLKSERKSLFEVLRVGMKNVVTFYLKEKQPTESQLNRLNDTKRRFNEHQADEIPR